MDDLAAAQVIIQRCIRSDIGINTGQPSKMIRRSVVFDMKIPSQVGVMNDISAITRRSVILIWHKYALSASKLRNNKPEQYSNTDCDGTNSKRHGSHPTYHAGTGPYIFGRSQGGRTNISTLFHLTNVLDSQ